ncbi:ABC transporter permease [Plantactinospora solaniradicis]|uniref:ABC transporter permease n=1 Tax=Plantactinospora solaniradicis TaxID=1723736 RepID=A0ABW1KA52_9ACTN
MNARSIPAPAVAVPAGEVDSRGAYLSFTLAYVIGHGSAALSKGADPVLSLPAWLPITLFVTGLIPALVLGVRAGIRSQQGAGESRKHAESLLGIAWCTAFTALFLAITGLTRAFDQPGLQDMLWAAGSVLIVGLMNIAEGTARRNNLHYTLGSWLALVAATSLFTTDILGVYTILAIAAGGGYAVATVLEHRRIAALSTASALRTGKDPVDERQPDHLHVR